MNVHTPIEPESTAGQKIGLHLLPQNNPSKRHAKSEPRWLLEGQTLGTKDGAREILLGTPSTFIFM